MALIAPCGLVKAFAVARPLVIPVTGGLQRRSALAVGCMAVQALGRV
jgi:hypothetical protein